jgi:hypothetical protein
MSSSTRDRHEPCAAGSAAAANELVLADSAFVFSADREGSTPWLRNRVT